MNTDPEILTPINVRESLTVEEALGISEVRFQHLGWIIDEIWSKKKTKAEALLEVSNTNGLSDIEKVYLGYKIHERIANISVSKVPLVGGMIRSLLK